jgi:glycosyltransferase involved in cell wall biosynthesis
VLLERLTLRTADAVIATNESFRENALRHGVPGHKVTVVRNGPATGEVAPPATGEVAGPRRPGRPAAAGRPAPARREHRIVYLGVLGPQDNVELAVLASEHLARRRGRTGWRLTIAGDGESMPALAKLVADRGLSDLVELTGWLEGPQVDALLRSATVAVQPDAFTRMNDLSTMAKTVEYLARGVPVVAADLRETRRTAGPAAVYLPHATPEAFAGALDDLLDDPAARARMRREALDRFAGKLSWDRQAEAYLSVWRRLAGTPASGEPR